MKARQNLFKKMNVITPVKGDIRLVAELLYAKDGRPYGKIHTAKCTETTDTHAIYEFIGEDKEIVVPYELTEDYGFININDAVKDVLDRFLKEKLITAKTDISKNGLTAYYDEIKNFVILSRQMLKEAEVARKRVYEKDISVWSP